MTSLGMRLAVIITVSLVVPTCSTGATAAKSIPVEFWHMGDDGLSERLAEKVETAFKASPEFVLGSEKKPGALIVTIPANAGWSKVGKRTKVHYTVEFSSVTNHKIGVNEGSCWEDTLAKCAAGILQDAKVAARKLPRD